MFLFSCIWVEVVVGSNNRGIDCDRDINKWDAFAIGGGLGSPAFGVVSRAGEEVLDAEDIARPGTSTCIGLLEDTKQIQSCNSNRQRSIPWRLC